MRSGPQGIARDTAMAGLPASLVDEVSRPRLLEQLNRRWDVPLVLVEAPGGYGKSTLLAQALRSNAANPTGRDIYIRTNNADRDPRVLLASMLSALDVAADREAGPDQLASAILADLRRSSPTQVSLVFDDVHRVADVEPITQLLGELLDQLPANVHLVLSGRSLPRLPMARLLAQDHVVHLTSEDLAFVDEELAALARHHDVAQDQLSRTGGWPAVARLTAAVGQRQSVDFMMEEVVAKLPQDVAEALRVVLVAGSGDEALFQAAGLNANPAELAEAVPLVDVLSDGSVRPHDLWREAAERLVPLAERQSLASLVAAWQLERGRFHEAIDTAAAAELWDVARSALCAAISMGDASLSAPTAEGWLKLFPPSQGNEPEIRLVRGLVARLNNGLGHGLDDIEAACAEFVARDNLQGEIAASWEIGMAAWARNDLERIFAVYLRSKELAAQGVDDMELVHGMVEATMADMQGDFLGAISHFETLDYESGPADIAVLGLRHWSTMLFLTGRAQEALEVAERLVARSRTDATEAILAMARFQNGDPEPFRDAWPPAQGFAHGNARDDFLIGVYTTAVHASFGIAGDLDFVSLATERSREQAFAALSKAMHHVAAGNEPAAVEVFSEHLQAVPLEDPMNAGEIGKFAPYSYVLSAEARDWLDQADLGPKLVQRRQLGKALVDARAGRGVDWSVAHSYGDVFCGLALPWSVELAAWWAETDVEAGSELLEYLTELAPGSARNLLRSLADGGADNKPTPAAGARAILSHVPAQPEVPLHLQLCGALSIGVGAQEPATSPTRARVRQLLSLLTLRKEVRRDEAIDLLWPDTDPSKARNSLRVTLGYLRDALEPNRVAGEASFHLRATADTLRLRRSPALRVDVWDIEAELKAAQALDVGGHHQQASEHCQRAAALWRGEAWQDLRGSIDLMAELSVFDQRIAQAVAQAGEWSYTTGDFDDALARAEQVLENDPYNERGHRLAISALIALGRSGAAAQARDRCLRALSEFGVRPSEQTEMVLRRLRASA